MAAADALTIKLGGVDFSGAFSRIVKRARGGAAEVNGLRCVSDTSSGMRRGAARATCMRQGRMYRLTSGERERMLSRRG